MRQGCISLGRVQCDQCHRIIPHSQRYLAINEEEGADLGNRKATRYCVECALEKGYAYYKDGKGERILTFFPKPQYEPGQLGYDKV